MRRILTSLVRRSKAGPTIGPDRRSAAAGMSIDHARQRALAHRAERHGIAREHDAVDRGAVERLRVVVRALEYADLPGVLGGREQLHLRLLLLAEETRHFRLGPLVGADA